MKTAETPTLTPVEIQKEIELRELFSAVSKPRETLRKTFGRFWSDSMVDPQDSKKVIIKYHPHDTNPDTFLLDDIGRPIKEMRGHKTTEYLYDADGYLTSSDHCEATGQGWKREYEYEQLEDGSKRLKALRVTRYSGYNEHRDASDDRIQVGKIEVVNFDETVNPDKLIPLWVY